MADFNKAIFEVAKNPGCKDKKMALDQAIDKITSHFGYSGFVAKEIIATIHHTARCNIETAVETLNLLMEKRAYLHPSFREKAISTFNSLYGEYEKKVGSELAEFMITKNQAVKAAESPPGLKGARLPV